VSILIPPLIRILVKRGPKIQLKCAETCDKEKIIEQIGENKLNLISQRFKGFLLELYGEKITEEIFKEISQILEEFLSANLPELVRDVYVIVEDQRQNPLLYSNFNGRKITLIIPQHSDYSDLRTFLEILTQQLTQTRTRSIRLDSMNFKEFVPLLSELKREIALLEELNVSSEITKYLINARDLFKMGINRVRILASNHNIILVEKGISQMEVLCTREFLEKHLGKLSDLLKNILTRVDYLELIPLNLEILEKIANKTKEFNRLHIIYNYNDQEKPSAKISIIHRDWGLIASESPVVISKIIKDLDALLNMIAKKKVIVRIASLQDKVKIDVNLRNQKIVDRDFNPISTLKELLV